MSQIEEEMNSDVFNLENLWAQRERVVDDEENWSECLFLKVPQGIGKDGTQRPK